MKDGVNVLIGARGGSQRVPRKNAKMFCGYPLLAWTIAAAVCAECVDDVYLSTDDDELEAIGWDYGATVVRRPDWMCGEIGDELTFMVPMRHMLEEIASRNQQRALSCVMLPTSPLRVPGDVDRHIIRHLQAPTDKFPKDVVLQTIGMSQNQDTTLYEIDSSGRARVSINDKTRKYWTYAGAVNVMATEGYKELHRRMYDYFDTPAVTDAMIDEDLMGYSEKTTNVLFNYVPMKMWQAFEIDQLDQFNLCQQLFKHFVLNNGKRDPLSVYRR